MVVGSHVLARVWVLGFLIAKPPISQIGGGSYEHKLIARNLAGNDQTALIERGKELLKKLKQMANT